MAQSSLREISLVDLLVEFLLDGQARYLIELVPLEPMNVAAILAELQNRTGQDHGIDHEAWCAWFLGSLPDGSENERRAIEFAWIKRRLRAFEGRAERKRR